MLPGHHGYPRASDLIRHKALKGRKYINAKLPDKNADSVVQACARVLLPLGDRITYDNGKEFASHAQIATPLGALSYFAKPYHSWERGLNEHTLTGTPPCRGSRLDRAPSPHRRSIRA